MDIFDRNLLKINKAKNSASFQQSSFLYQCALDSLATRLFLKTDYEKALLLGFRNLKESEQITENRAIGNKFFADSNIDFLKEMPGQQILVDEENLPFASSSFDLVISLLNIHTINDVAGFLSNILRILRPGGVFIGSLYGSRSLWELKEAFVTTELELTMPIVPHIFPMTDIKEIANLAACCGFAEPVSDNEIITVHYSDLSKLFDDLKNMGERNILYSRSRSPLAKNFFNMLKKNYHQRFSIQNNNEILLPVTFEIIYLTCFKK